MVLKLRRSIHVVLSHNDTGELPPGLGQLLLLRQEERECVSVLVAWVIYYWYPTRDISPKRGHCYWHSSISTESSTAVYYARHQYSPTMRVVYTDWNQMKHRLGQRIKNKEYRKNKEKKYMMCNKMSSLHTLECAQVECSCGWWRHQPADSWWGNQWPCCERHSWQDKQLQ